MKKELFLISSSKLSGTGSVFFAHVLEPLSKFLGPARPGHNKVMFFPLADPDCNYDGHTEKVSVPFREIGYEIISVHTYTNTLPEYISQMISNPAIVAIFIGGGNTWVLQNELYERRLVSVIRENVMTGRKKYIGSSAGTVVACPTILTTNDMPPVLPPTINAFGFVPFQINPHFVPGPFVPGHMGETREERIRQVMKKNPELEVVGLPEGGWLEVKDKEYTLCGSGEAIIFTQRGANLILSPGERFGPICGL